MFKFIEVGCGLMRQRRYKVTAVRVFLETRGENRLVKTQLPATVIKIIGTYLFLLTRYVKLKHYIL